MAAPSVAGSRWFRDALLFGLLILLPVGIFFYLQWPDWSWLYFVDPDKLSETVTFFVWLAYPLALVAGFALAALSIRGDSPRFSLVVPAVALAALAGGTAYAWARFVRLTNFFEFNASAPQVRAILPKVWDDTTWLLTMAGTGALIFLPFAYLVVRNVREGGRGFLPPAKPE